MQLNDLDRICLRDYVVGLGWALLSLAGAFLSLYFDNLPIAVQVNHSEGLGIGQIVIGGIFLISFLMSIGYLIQTAEYQKYLGK